MTRRKGGRKQAANIAKVSQGIYWQRQESCMIRGSSWLKGVTFTTFAILARKTTSTTSENERRPEVMCSLSSCYANDVLWEFIFDEETFSSKQVTEPPRKIEKWQFRSLFTRKSFFCTFKKPFYSSNIFVSGDDPICVSCVFGNLNCSPKMGDFSSFCLTKGLPNGHFCHFLKCCHILLVCLLLLLFFA